MAVQSELSTNPAPLTHASGVPTFPNFYNADTIRHLPTTALAENTLRFTAGLPADVTFHDWAGSQKLTSGTCNIIGQNATFTSNLAYNDIQMWYNPGGAVLSKTANGDYTETTTFVEVGRPVVNHGVITFSVLNENHITGTSTSTETPGTTCVYNWDLNRVEPVATAPPTATP